MSQRPASESPWVIFQLRDELYALDAYHAQEMLVVPGITPVPRSPTHVRGVINLRGKVITLLDLRLRLGMPSSRDDVENLVKLLEQREEDHRKWLAELEASVKDNRTFRLTTDPHACAFGKWYDGFHTDDLKLGAILMAFDHPHKQIHAIGQETRQLVDRGEHEKALALIERTRHGALAKMITLFEQARHMIRKQQMEIAIVLEQSGQNLAITVDNVLAVEPLAAGSVQELPSTASVEYSGLVSWLGQRQEGGASVLVLDLTRLWEIREGSGGGLVSAAGAED